MTLAALLAAIIQVESGGDCNAVGDYGLAIGPAQIHSAYWADAMEQLRRAHLETWPYAAVVDRHKAEATVVFYLMRYAPKRYSRAYKGTATMKDMEMLARIHNGGPHGTKKKATLAYWDKVQAELAKEKG